MDSINKQQQEDNFENLHGEEATKKMKELTDKAPVCFFCTNIQTGNSFATRPMALQEIDDNGCFWFLSADDSHKNSELQNDPYVQLLFKGSDYSDFLSVYGTATANNDKERIKDRFAERKKSFRILLILQHGGLFCLHIKQPRRRIVIRGILRNGKLQNRLSRIAVGADAADGFFHGNLVALAHIDAAQVLVYREIIPVDRKSVV